MEEKFLILFLLLACSCGQVTNSSEPEKEFFFLNDSINSFINLPELKKTDSSGWILYSNIFDDLLQFEKLKTDNEVPIEKGLFCFVDSNKATYAINYAPGCADGMVIFDTINWSNKNDTVEMHISGIQIHQENFDHHFVYKKTNQDSEHFSYEKIVR